MSTDLTTYGANGSTPSPEAIEALLIQGNLAALNPEQRVAYYKRVCESVGLNPLTQPLEYVTLSGKLRLYAKRDATDQLRKIHRVAVIIVDRRTENDVHTVTARATTPDGRTDESTGSVPVAGLKGEALANALMKAETKAKRRVTLSICGLGMLDETELETVPSAKQEPAKTLADVTARLAPASNGAAARVVAVGDHGKTVVTEDGLTSVPLDAPPGAGVPDAEFAIISRDASGKAEVSPEPVVPKQEERTPAAVATALCLRIASIENKHEAKNWRRKHQQELDALKAASPADYDRVLEAMRVKAAEFDK